ncbi:hypothetical protein IGI37_003523 [Enterococcus sp. AZ194]|uniref:type II toxin-antitoxin system RelB/DinJ family antitoxin n=1 Tax=Enterococcus sp. AZ194 TaxID=2774629 RepID=UPI003F1F1FF9
MAQINIKLDDDLKKEAQQVFSEMEMDVSTGVRVFLKQVVRTGQLPFIPKSDTAQAIYEAENLEMESYDTVDEWWQRLNDE